MSAGPPVPFSVSSRFAADGVALWTLVNRTPIDVHDETIELGDAPGGMAPRLHDEVTVARQAPPARAAVDLDDARAYARWRGVRLPSEDFSAKLVLPGAGLARSSQIGFRCAIGLVR